MRQQFSPAPPESSPVEEMRDIGITTDPIGSSAPTRSLKHNCSGKREIRAGMVRISNTYGIKFKLTLHKILPRQAWQKLPNSNCKLAKSKQKH